MGDQPEKPGLIYTFYSYKGGVGRSMALANVAALMTKWNHKVLIVDWDLEAPGLEMFFERVANLEDKRAATPGVIDLLESRTTSELLSWTECLIRIPMFGKTLDFITAGRKTDDYRKRVQNLDWATLFREYRIGNYINGLRQEWKKAYNYVLIDSRMGITDIGDICTVLLPDVLILLFTSNYQNIHGIRDVMVRAYAAQQKLLVDRSRLIGVPVPARDETHTEYDKSQEWKRRFAKELGHIYRDWLPRSVEPREALNKLFIPYVTNWSFGERLPVVENPDEIRNPTSISAAYGRLTSLLVNGLDWSALERKADVYEVEDIRMEAKEKQLTTEQEWRTRASRRARWSAILGALLVVTLLLITAALTDILTGTLAPSSCGSGAGNIKDEAFCLGRTEESFPGADEDYFRDMDYGITKDPKAVAAALDPYVPGISPEDAVKAIAKGRNNWIVWTAGNDRLWDQLSRDSRGNLDLLKIISNHLSLKFSRANRWQYLGIVNEPCFEKGQGPRADRYGLWLDVRQKDCPPDPFENETKYPGVKISARGKNMPVGSYYGYATGIVGLRLFPNPDFDEAAQKRWDPERYYTDPDYYNDKKLVKPYRVGMSCSFCHVGPNPTKPPKDPENPKWENLNSNPGAQYFRWDRIFIFETDPSSFAYQLFHTSRPGALDTSLVSTDYISNPRTMNAVYSLGPRLVNALRLGQETLGGGELNNAHFNDYVFPGIPLTSFFKAPDTVWTPRLLKDGADSVGVLGALNRFFINIGLFSEEWLEHFRPFIGGKPISPFPIEVARKNSSYWKANEMQTPDTALFLLATAQPDYLKNAPGGEKYLSNDKEKLTRGKKAFAERCARCHSSKLPEKAYSFFPDGCVGPNYLSCWERYWEWTKTDEFKREMRDIVRAEDFLKDNFLSTELRVPVPLLETNACSPLATNAIGGNIWDNFSSESYKKLPSVGTITAHHPITGEPRQYVMPAGGRGYTRPASLISLWSTAPYLLNNTVGVFYWTGSVEDRMKSFNDSIQKMLWPEKRDGSRKYMTASGKEVPGVIDVTTERSYLRVPTGYLPDFSQPLVGILHRWFPWLFGEGGVEIGPIPKGTPVNLISNMDLDKKAQMLPVLIKLKKALKAIPPGVSDEEAIKVFNDRNLIDAMLEVNKCPDFVVNRGHYFGTDYFAEETGLSDEDKWTLIEFLKTM